MWRLASRARIVTISDMTRNVPDKNCRVGTLPHRGLISISGSDAARLLQGQLSNDVMALAVAAQQFTSLNSPKGRLLATGYLFRTADQVYCFDVPSRLVEPVLKRLRMFILRSDVRIEAATELSATAVMGDVGNQPTGLADDVLAALKDWRAGQKGGRLLAEGGFIAARPGEMPRWVVWSPSTLTAATPDLTSAWQLADILAGVPNLAPETQDRFIAQHAGVDRLEGISFTKGCFTGQEVIARLHYLGQAKRFLALGSSAQAPSAGHRLTRTLDDSTVGEVIESVMTPEQSYWLAVIQGDAFAPIDLHLAPDQPLSSLQYFTGKAVNDS